MSDDDDFDYEEDEHILEDFEQEFLDQQKRSKWFRVLFILLLLGGSVAGVTHYYQLGYFDEYIHKYEKPEIEEAAEVEPENGNNDPLPQVPTDEFLDEIDFLEEPSEEPSKGVTETATVVEKKKVIPKEAKPKAAVVAKKPEPKKEKKKIVKKSPPKTPAMVMKEGKTYTIQVGIFAVKSNAERIVGMLQEAGLKPSASKTVISTSRLKLFAGHYPFREVAMDAADNLLKMGFKPKVQIMRGGVYSLDMGTFLSAKKAQPLISRLEDKGIDLELIRKPTKVPAIIVFLKNIDGGEEFEKAKALLDKENIRYLVKK